MAFIMKLIVFAVFFPFDQLAIRFCAGVEASDDVSPFCPAGEEVCPGRGKSMMQIASSYEAARPQKQITTNTIPGADVDDGIILAKAPGESRCKVGGKLHSVPLNSTGFDMVQFRCCAPEMADFIERVINRDGNKVCNYGSLNGLTSFYDCPNDNRNYTSLVADLQSAQQPPCAWIKSNLASACPVMGASCPQASASPAPSSPSPGSTPSSPPAPSSPSSPPPGSTPPSPPAPSSPSSPTSPGSASSPAPSSPSSGSAPSSPPAPSSTSSPATPGAPAPAATTSVPCATSAAIATTTAAPIAFTQVGGTKEACAGVGGAGELPMVHKHPLVLQSECESISAGDPESVGYMWEADRKLCYIYFATPASCTTAYSTFPTGWTERCTACAGGCPTYSASGPFLTLSTAQGDQYPYTCHYKGTITTTTGTTTTTTTTATTTTTTTTAAPSTFTQVGGTKEACAGVGGAGELPMVHKHPLVLQSECETISAGESESVGYMWEADRKLCYIYFATPTSCNTAYSTFPTGWTERCTACFDGCPTYSASGPFLAMSTAGGDQYPYTCHYKGTIASR